MARSLSYLLSAIDPTPIFETGGPTENPSAQAALVILGVGLVLSFLVGAVAMFFLGKLWTIPTFIGITVTLILSVGTLSSPEAVASRAKELRGYDRSVTLWLRETQDIVDLKSDHPFLELTDTGISAMKDGEQVYLQLKPIEDSSTSYVLIYLSENSFEQQLSEGRSQR